MDDISFVATVHLLVLMLACPLGGLFSSRFGRRTSLLVSSPVVAAGWIVIALAQDYATILIGRAVGAFGLAFVMATVGVYISEISHTKYRGSLAAVQSLALNSGLLTAYALGYAAPLLVGERVGYRVAAALAGTVPAATFLLMWLQPETPHWLIHEGRLVEAK